MLGYEPQISFETGLRQLAGWLQSQTPVDRIEAARAELETRGLAL